MPYPTPASNRCVSEKMLVLKPGNQPLDKLMPLLWNPSPSHFARPFLGKPARKPTRTPPPPPPATLEPHLPRKNRRLGAQLREQLVELHPVLHRHVAALPRGEPRREKGNGERGKGGLGQGMGGGNGGVENDPYRGENLVYKLRCGSGHIQCTKPSLSLGLAGFRVGLSVGLGVGLCRTYASFWVV